MWYFAFSLFAIARTLYSLNHIKKSKIPNGNWSVKFSRLGKLNRLDKFNLFEILVTLGRLKCLSVSLITSDVMAWLKNSFRDYLLK